MTEFAEIQLRTTGMHCRSCSMFVDIVVGEVEGVVSVSTDHATGLTEVLIRPDAVNLEAIIAAVRTAGCDAERI